MLSRSQVYRLVAETPERVTIPLLLALCDILDCQLTDLAVALDPAKGQPKARKKTTRKKAVGETGELPSSAVPTSFFTRS